MSSITILEKPDVEAEKEARRLALVEIAQAFSYHRLVAQVALDDDKSDGDNDGNGDGDDNESDNEGDQQEQNDENDENNGDGEDGDNEDGGNEDGDNDGDDSDDSGLSSDFEDSDFSEIGSDHGEPTIELTRVGFGDALLYSTAPAYSSSRHRAPRPTRGCSNSIVREDMWMDNPRFHLMDSGMGFLSQLAQLCIQSKVRTCGHKSCKDSRDKLEFTAPTCNWGPFRDWALTSMSCQETMSHEQKTSQAHTHLARVVAGFCMTLKRCVREKNRKTQFRPYLDGHADSVDLAGVSNLVYWMAKIQADSGIGPRSFGRWGHGVIPDEVSLPAIEKASMMVEQMSLCKNRLWSLVNVSDRKQSDLPDIMLALKPHAALLAHDQHDACTPNKCQWSAMNATSVGQLHKKPCHAADVENPPQPLDCDQHKFPVELLETAVELGKSTAWLINSSRRLSGPRDDYIAISHVWSDGTGVGVKKAGSVNGCLFDYFALVAKKLDCKAIWWDALSIPYEAKARSKALNKMHSNYANAKYTVVHDKYLLNFEFKPDGSPCLALVLSTWFTRGWTALELAMSKEVKVLFKGTTADGMPDIRDLERDVLAKSPATSSRAHWLATCLIRRLRDPVHNVGDLLAILSPRSTSWVRDRTIIAALLAGVPGCDFGLGESLITQSILTYLGKIPYGCLLHGKATMKDFGKYSWCAATLDDMPVDSSEDLEGGSDAKDLKLLDIQENGAVDGGWYCRTLLLDPEKHKITPYGNDLASVVKIQNALRHREHCLLLRPDDDEGTSDLALLVVPFAVLKKGPVIKCRYIGAVNEDRGGKRLDLEKDKDWFYYEIQIGGEDKDPLKKWKAKAALDTAGEYEDIFDNDSEDELNSDDEADVPDDAITGTRQMEIISTEEKTSWYQRGTTALYRPLLLESGEDSSLLLHFKSAHLSKALERDEKEVVHYLVKRGVDFTDEEKASLVEDQGGKDSEYAFQSVKLLGDAYAANDRFDDALEMYATAVQGYESMDPKDIDDTHEVMEANFARGNLLLKVVRMESAGLTRWGMNGEYINTAEELLEKVLSMCNEKAMRKETKKAEKKAEKQKEEAKNTAKGTTGKDVPKDPLKDPKVAIQKIESNSQNRADKWFKTEMNTIGELVLLQADSGRFSVAAKSFKRALQSFGMKEIPEPVNLEAFSLRWDERSIQSHEEKDKHDKIMADIYERALKRFDIVFKKHHTIVFLACLSLGVNLFNRGKFQEAEDNFERALEGFKKLANPDTGNIKSRLRSAHQQDNGMIMLTRYHYGRLLTNQHKYEDAGKMLRMAKAGSEMFFGQDSELALATTFALGQFCQQDRNADLTAAKQHFEDVISRIEAQAPNEMWSLLLCRAKVAHTEVRWQIFKARRKAQGESLDEGVEAETRRMARYTCDGIRNWHDAICARSDIATLERCEILLISSMLYDDEKNYTDAASELNLCLSAYTLLIGVDSVGYLRARKRMGSLKQKIGQEPEAEEILQAVVTGFETSLGTYHTDTLKTELKLGILRLKRGKLEEARKSCDHAYQGLEKLLGPNTKVTAEAAQVLGGVYMEQGQFTKAKETYLKAYEGFKKSKEGAEKETLLARLDFAKACAALGDDENFQEAEMACQEALKGFAKSKKFGPAHSFTLGAKLKLGEVFRQQKEWDWAEFHIQGAINKLKKGSRTMAEAKLQLAHLRYDRLQEDDAEDDDHAAWNEVRDLVDAAMSGLARHQDGNEKDMASLDAQALLGELYLSHADDEATREAGEAELNDALNACTQRPTAAHPVTLRVLDRLIQRMVSSPPEAGDRKLELKALLTEKRNQLKRAHGADYAAMVLRMTNPMRARARRPPAFERDGSETYGEDYDEGIEDLVEDDDDSDDEGDDDDDDGDDDDEDDGSDWDSDLTSSDEDSDDEEEEDEEEEEDDLAARMGKVHLDQTPSYAPRHVRAAERHHRFPVAPQGNRRSPSPQAWGSHSPRPGSSRAHSALRPEPSPRQQYSHPQQRLATPSPPRSAAGYSYGSVPAAGYVAGYFDDSKPADLVYAGVTELFDGVLSPVDITVPTPSPRVVVYGNNDGPRRCPTCRMTLGNARLFDEHLDFYGHGGRTKVVAPPPPPPQQQPAWSPRATEPAAGGRNANHGPFPPRRQHGRYAAVVDAAGLYSGRGW